MTERAAIVVRRAEPHDVAALLRLKVALQNEEDSAHTFAATSDQWLRQLFGKQKVFEALVANSEASVVGMLIFNLKHYTGWPTPGVNVQDLFVEPGFRRMGVGLRLLQELARCAQAYDAEHIEFVVRADNPARRFYERAGFFKIENAIIYIGGRALIETLVE